MELNELKSLRSEVLKYQSVFDRVDALRDQLERITAQYGAEPHGGGNGDKMSDMVSQIVDILNNLCAELIEIEKKRYKAEQEIKKLPAQQEEIMYLRYIDGMSWEKIAKKTHYSRSHLTKIHRAAAERMKHEADRCGCFIKKNYNSEK